MIKHRMPYYVLDSSGLSSVTRRNYSRLTQKWVHCKCLQANITVSILYRVSPAAKIARVLAGIKYRKNNMISRKSCDNSAFLTILAVSTTISTFTKRKRKSGFTWNSVGGCNELDFRRLGTMFMQVVCVTAV